MARLPILDSASAQKLDALLRNESDVAYKRRVRRMLAYLELQPGQTVLDCGTGMGFYLKAISTVCPGCRLAGIDFSNKVLRFAQGHLLAPAAGAAPELVLARGDIHRLPFASAAFDRIVMSEVLEHLGDDATALREVWRVLKPGGLLVMTVPHRHYSAWYDPINRVAEGLFRAPIRTGPFAGIWANHERLYLPDELRRKVESAGFRIEVLEELTHYCFPGTQTIVYTLGKGLIDHNLLPGFIGRSTHRFRGEENKGNRWNPINWVLALFNRIDRLNEDPARMARVHTFVNVALKARKV